jgi:hypothetical protein
MDEQETRVEFEKQGVYEVRHRLKSGFLNTPEDGWARKWLIEKDQEEDRRREASQAESLEVAKSARDAAWEAARAARIANNIAAAALVAAAIAIIVSVISLIHSHS